MKDLKFKIKDIVTSNKHLRHIRNGYKDYRSIVKYKIIQLINRPGKQPVEQQFMPLNDQEIDEKYQSILMENRSLLKLKNFGSDAPLVSIIILNRDGLNHLEKLFKDFQNNVEYTNYEILVVDNASTDDSIRFLEQLPLPVKIIKNTENRSFSAANNQAVREANGEFLLLLNNDVEPTYGWLNQMMQAALKEDGIGAVGAKLIYPYQDQHPHSFKIQHTGIAFKEEDGFIKPYNLGEGQEPFQPETNREQARAGVTGACMLVRKELYQEVGGLDEGYSYGYEDVDFCLKLNRKGYKNI